MSNLVNMVMALVLNLLNPTAPVLPVYEDANTTEAVIECQIHEDYTVTVLRFETENC